MTTHSNSFGGRIDLVIFLGLLGLLWVVQVSEGTTDSTQLTGQRNTAIQWEYESPKRYEKPFDIEIDAIITNSDGDGDGERIVLPGYWAGGSRWAFRFSAAEPGEYRFTTRCSDTANADLHGRTGSIRVTGYRGDNPLLKRGPIHLSENRRYFEHVDGTPMFWLADSWWHGMTTRVKWPGEFKRFAADRKRKGFTVIQFAIALPCDIEPFDPRGANEAGHAWTADFESINPAYFDRVDERVTALVEAGLVPNVVGAWGYYLPSMGVEKAKRHWRYLVARYGALPVVWTVCGEAVLAPYGLAGEEALAAREAQRRGWAEVARYIEQIDPYDRLMTVHPGPGSGKLEPLTDMKPLDFVMIQPGHRDASIATAVAHLAMGQELYPDRPVLIGEACFEGMNGECQEKIQRILFWSSVLRGAPGFSYGADGIWQFNRADEPFGPSPLGHVWGNTPWPEAAQWPGSKHVGVGAKILAKYPWHELKPHPEWISPAGSAEEPRDAFIAGVPGKLRLAYFPDGIKPWNMEYVVHQLNPGRRYAAKFVDPSSGKEHPVADVDVDEQGDWKVPFAPVLHDWVLVIEVVK